MFSGAHAATERVVAPEIDSVGLFKNGVVMVRASFRLDGPGTYRWDDVPSPIHGTFQVTARGPVRTTASHRRVETTPEREQATGDPQRDLAGKNVRLRMKADSGGRAEVAGRVWEVPTPEGPEGGGWDRDYASMTPGGHHGGAMFSGVPWMHRESGREGAPVRVAGADFLILENEDGREYVDLGSVAVISAEGPFKPRAVAEDRPVLLFEVEEAEPGDRVDVFYLTRGMAWMPSYTVEIGEERARIRQTGMVRNELQDVDGAVASLVSGFPHIRFGHVDSPLSPGADLSGFFAQALQMPGRRGGSSTRGDVTSQMIAFNVASAEAMPGDAADALADGVDMHFLDIGPLRLAAGETMAMEVAAAEADYERVVEWKAEDRRDAFGRHRNQPDETGPEAWDALRLRNPFDFPITTAPVQFHEDGKFRGQGQTHFVNPGQRMNLRVNKALSVTVRHHEVEEEIERQHVRIGGTSYRVSRVSGTLEVANHRSEALTMIAGVEFSGKLTEAEGDPQTRLRAEGVWSVNPRREMEWRLDVPAGGSVTLEYSYEVMVRR